MKTTIKLDDPISYGSETISSLELRKPKAKDMRGLPLQMGMDDMLKLAGRVSGQPDSVIDELSINDLGRVMEVVGNFMQAGRATGKTV